MRGEVCAFPLTRILCILIFLLSCASCKHETITIPPLKNIAFEKPAVAQYDKHNPAGGGIVPHHLLAAPLIESFYATLAARIDPKTSTIVLLGPDHRKCARNALVTTLSSWQYENTLISPDTKILRRLMHHASVCTDERVFRYEHSISSQIPFIARYLKGKKIVPLVIHPDAQPETLRRCADTLSRCRNTVFILSMDFSHYNDEQTTIREDMESLQWLGEKNFNARKRVSLDCKGGAAMLMRILESAGYTQREVLAHGTSFDYGAEGNDGTGYFTIIYQRR